MKKADKTEKLVVTSENKPERDERGRLLPGNTANPLGYGVITQEERDRRKIEKKATEQFINEYKEGLAKALPKISPVLIKKAISGDISAIKEVNTRVMGNPVTPVDITTGGEKIYNWNYGNSNNIQPKKMDQKTTRESTEVEGSSSTQEVW